MSWYAGVDLGGTTIKWTSADDGGVNPDVHSVPTPCGPHRVRKAIAECVRQMQQTRGSRPTMLCVGTPGLVGEDGRFVGPVVNIGGWQATDPRYELETDLGIPVVVKNDTTLALLAEARAGEESPDSMVGLFLGTGIGGGLFLNGELYEGVRGIAGEIGHMVVEPGGRRCGCGARGCLEQYASGTGLTALARERADLYDTDLARWIRATTDITAADLFRHPEDKLAVEVIALAGDMLARAVGAVIMMLAPQFVILGGGVMESGAALRDVMLARLPLYTIPESRAQTRIVGATLGSAAGAIGAALYAGVTSADR
jgi:glucokinase